MGRKPANVCVSVGLNQRRRSHSRQDPPGYEQKPHKRPTTPGEQAADCETKPEEWSGGRCGTWAGTDHVLIWGDPESVPASKSLASKGGAVHAQVTQFVPTRSQQRA